jgi:hypothetical protein
MTPPDLLEDGAFPAMSVGVLTVFVNVLWFLFLAE